MNNLSKVTIQWLEMTCDPTRTVPMHWTYTTTPPHPFYTLNTLNTFCTLNNRSRISSIWHCILLYCIILYYTQSCSILFHFILFFYAALDSTVLAIGEQMERTSKVNFLSDTTGRSNTQHLI
jgi:hypothetical protein